MALNDEITSPRSPDDLYRLDAHAAATLIRNRELSPVALASAMLKRIDKLDPNLESYAYVTSAQAMEQAARAEDDVRRGIIRGPLHGVPVAVKDLCDTAGIPTAAGFAILRDRRPAENATVIDRLAASGTVLLGKLRTSEGAFSVHNDGRPAPRNPWSADHWAGHSSSGSGVATAAGLAFATIGTDTGGSIRYPASANGVVGLKPTWGRVSRHGIFPMAASLDHVGTIARSVTDAALMLGIIAGYDEKDPTSTGRPVPDFQHHLAAPRQDLRIAVDRRLIGDGVNHEVCDTIARVERVFRDLGATFLDVALPSPEPAIEAWLAISGAEAAIAHRELYAQHRTGYGPRLAAFLERGARVDVEALTKAALIRLAWSEHIDLALLDADAILLPAQCWAPPTLVQMAERGTDPGFVAGLLRFTAPFDLTGHPTLTLPGTLGKSGVPIGFQLIGRKFDETTLLGAGLAYETAAGRLTPPVFDSEEPASTLMTSS